MQVFRTSTSILAVILTGLAASGCQPAAEADSSRFETAEVTFGDIRDIVPAIGEVQPAEQVEVGAEITGRLLALHADFGQPVSAGDLLAQIDPAPYRARLDQAHAMHRTAQARLDAASAQLERAEAELARAQQLAANDFAPDSLLEDRTFNANERRADVEQAEAELEIAASRVEQAEIDLTLTEIRSPIDGFILDRRVEAGQTVSAAQSSPTLFIVSAGLENILIEAMVAENDIGRVSNGLNVRFTVEAYPDEEFFGTVEQMRQAPERRGRFVSYPVIVHARDSQRRLLPGMTASVEFIHQEARMVVRVPIEALSAIPDGYCPEAISDEMLESVPGFRLPESQELLCAARVGAQAGLMIRQNQRRLFVMHDGDIEMRPVRIGAEDDTHVEIIHGDVAVGDTVLVRDRHWGRAWR